MPQKYSLQVLTDIYALAKVQQWFQQFDYIPERVWSQCNLVLTEGFTNVICHAHEYLPIETPVDIEITTFDNAIEMRIWDYGAPFDFMKKLEEVSKQKLDLDLTDIDNIPTGGRGLLITHAIADQLSYERTENGRNCLIIQKNF
jgi:serine/threonine-protein kinase RsbW